MQVRLAETAGFCMGVRRAMSRVLDAVGKRGGRLVTYGPLIHNSQVTQLLEERSVAIVDRPEDVREGDRVAIRAHGVPPQVRAAIRERGAAICDATCPHVARAQGMVKRAALEGRDVVIVGDRGHAEVVGLLGFSRGRGYVVETLEDLGKLPPMGRVTLVAQTTQSEELYGAVEQELRRKYSDLEVHRTICGSTSDRQRETAQLSVEADIMVVVGGRHSANTMRLVQIARESGKPVVHVEGAGELQEESFKGHAVAGVTAGASTPNWVIEEVLTRLESFQTARSRPLVHLALTGLAFLVRGGFLVAVGAGALAYAAAQMLGRPFHLLHLVIPSTYVFSMLTWNLYVELRSGEVADRVRAMMFREHAGVLLALAGLLGATSLWLAALLGGGVLLVLLLAALLGVLYTIPVFPRIKGLPYRRLKDIPGSKNISFAGAVSVVTVVLPLLDPASGDVPRPLVAAGVPLLFVAVLAFARSVVLDVKDVQSDIFAGRETIPVLIGLRGTKILLAALFLAAASAVAGGVLLGWLGPAALWQLVTLVLLGVFLFLYRMRVLAHGVLFHLFLDASFLLAGAVAMVESFLR